MSNHYYAHGAVHNDQHKELGINGNLTPHQVVMIARDFFADKAGETAVAETSAEEIEETNTSNGAKEANGKSTTNQQEATSVRDNKLCLKAL